MAVYEATQSAVDVAQLYESEISDRSTGLGIRFVVLPAGSLVAPETLGDPEALLESLGLQQLSSPLSADALTAAIASVLMRDSDAAGAVEHFQLVLAHEDAFAGDHADILAFAEYATHAEVVPVQHSPLSA